MNISGKTVFITGGASGLGAATAQTLVAAGAHVALFDRDAEGATQTAQALGDAARSFAGDVCSAKDMAAGVDGAVAAFGALHAVVCCAGVAPPKRVLGREGPIALEDFAAVVSINLLGTLNAVRLAAHAMLNNPPDTEGERGVVVMTASIAAFEGQVGQAAYAASKGGVVSMTLPLAREFAQHGIRVMTLAPGLMDTPMMAGLPEEARASLGQQVPFPPRLGRPAEYAAQVLNILRSPLLNGATLRLDGAIRMAPR